MNDTELREHPDNDDVWGPMGDPKHDDCEACGTYGTDAADGEGRRICASCGARMQRRGDLNIAWDDDAPQEASMTAAVCGHCDEEVEFVDGDEAWQLKGKTAPGWDTRPFTCLSSPDHRHDPEPGSPLARCAHCGLTGDASLFEPFNGMNSVGNLACKAHASCEIRQGYADAVGDVLNARPDHADVFGAVIRDREARAAAKASPTVTVTYARKRWTLEFSKLPGQTFGPYDLPEAAGQLRVAALLEPLAARELLLDAAEAEDRTATAAVG